MKETSLPSEEGKGKSAPKGKAKMARSSQTGKQASAAQVNPATQNTKKGPGKKTVAPSVDKPQNRPVRKPSVKAKPESLQYLFRSDMPLADWNIGGVQALYGGTGHSHALENAGSKITGIQRMPSLFMGT
jgi:hypothetical protein